MNTELDIVLAKFTQSIYDEVTHSKTGAIPKNVLKQQIKDIMHEIIGDYEDNSMYAKPHLTKGAKWNQLKDIQHQRVNRL